jgi:lysozyme
MIAALEVDDYDRAAKEALDSRWAKQVGARAINIAHVMRGPHGT